MKPLALDLYCGIWEGGWANGLVKACWDVIGVDIEDQGGYVGHKILADVREIAKDVEAYFPALKFDLVVASPPCQEFSYRSFPFKRCRELAATVPPDTSLWESAVKIAKDLNCPLVLENVRGAQKYMGRAKAHYGAYYLWGDVPALLPIGSPRKGFTQEQGKKQPMLRDCEYNKNRRMVGECEGDRGKARKVLFEEMAHSKMGSKTSVRKRWSAKIAMIPEELAMWIGECFYPSELKRKVS